MNPIGQTITEFLEETAPLIEQADNLPYGTAVELYDMYQDTAHAAAENILEIDPELRVQTIDRLDNILERIVDFPLKFDVPQKNIFTAAINNCNRWRNVELMKDCGLSVYLLGKETGMKPHMLFGAIGEEFPYLDILPGMEVLLTDEDPGNYDTYARHLAEHYREMDALAVYGFYPDTPNYVNMYRHLRPDGKVYAALDMNRHWSSRMPWGGELVKNMASQCDVVATSCRKMRDELNGNPDVSFPCRWLTNGFYNPTGDIITADPDVKENIILTVGSIGSDIKNNQELLFAFAIASEQLPNWKLHLVGRIEPKFQPEIDAFFEKVPEMRDRVIFKGAITDKDKLYREYARAKIFALTSLSECFPNVYAEALFHGCMFVTSDIDAAGEMTKSGEFGIVYESGDHMTLAASLVKMCQYTAENSVFEKYIPKALAYAEKYFDWPRNARKLAYMMFKEYCRVGGV